jgi:hypothetical protein
MVLAGIDQGASDVLQPLREHAPPGAQAAHAVERIPQAALADADDATEPGERQRRIHVCPHVRFRGFDEGSPRRACPPESFSVATRGRHAPTRYTRPTNERIERSIRIDL